MSREADAIDGLSENGSPDADRRLAENFGMTVRRVREFDPQTLDVTRACKFLGLPLKRFDTLAGQPGERGRWVESVARQQKDLIGTFPEASKELKEMLEAIRKFALRKCLKPDGPAQLDGCATAQYSARSPAHRGSTQSLLIGGGALAALLLFGSAGCANATQGRAPSEAGHGGEGTRRTASREGRLRPAHGLRTAREAGLRGESTRRTRRWIHGTV